MVHHMVVGWLGLALLMIAILIVLRQQPLQSVPRLSCPENTAADDALRQLYVHTVKHSVTGILLQTPGYTNYAGPLSELKQAEFDHARRLDGEDWPVTGLTMAGLKRMDNIEMLVGRVLAADTVGDFVETGVWRGGASIVARAVLRAYGITDRKVHLVDSFMGLPKATTKEDSDAWVRMDYLRVSLEQVQASFQRYNLLDEQVAFYKGFFRYSMPEFRERHAGPVAILRMDGDMYESTMDVLFNIYDRVPVGGYCIVDDWDVPECQKAIKQFLDMHGGQEEVFDIDGSAVWWQKTRAAPLQHEWYQRFNTSRGTEA